MYEVARFTIFVFMGFIRAVKDDGVGDLPREGIFWINPEDGLHVFIKFFLEEISAPLRMETLALVGLEAAVTGVMEDPDERDEGRGLLLRSRRPGELALQEGGFLEDLEGDLHHLEGMGPTV